MPVPNTILLPNGEILTGRLWRKGHSFFNDLPFFSDIPRMDKMVGPLDAAFEDGKESSYKGLLVVSESLLCAVHWNLTAFNRNLPRV
jgi:hypothetical protein